MTTIRMLALDLDGTLTNSEKVITPETKAAVQAAAENGVVIVLASGRPVLGIRPVAKALELHRLSGYILAYNGGQILDCTTNDVVYERLIPRKYYRTIADLARSLNTAALTYDDAGVVTEKPNDKYVRREAFNNAIPIRRVDDLGAYVTWSTPKFMVVDEPEKLARVYPIMREAFQGQLNVFLSEPYFLEITPLGIEKASALGTLAETLGIARESIMAVGDGLNDIPMLAFAGVSVAMENAYPETKAVCSFVTASNDSDGVARAIERFIPQRSQPET